MHSAYAKGTRSNLQTQWSTYFAFLQFFKLKGVPTTHKILCLYATLLSRSFSATGSIRNYISGVRTLHSLLNHTMDPFDHPLLRVTLMGIERYLQHTPKRASPITPHILINIRKHLDLSKPIHATYWALITTAFFTMARKSNLVITLHKDSPDHHILRSDINFQQNHVVITFRSSKTNQLHHRTHQAPLVQIPGSPLCPVTALHNMLKLNPAPHSSPAFIFPNLSPIYYHHYQSFIKSAATSLHLNPDHYSSHSFRRGGATYAFQAHVPPELIKLHGDWKSDAYLIYLEYSLKQKLSVSRDMASSIKALSTSTHHNQLGCTPRTIGSRSANLSKI